MDFKTFWYGMPLEEREAFAKRIEKSSGYLQLVAGGFRAGSPKLATAIQEASDGKVTREEMRPDIFGPPRASPSAGAERAL